MPTPEVLAAAERQSRCRKGENRYFVYMPDQFGKPWPQENERLFNRLIEEDARILADYALAILAAGDDPCRTMLDRIAMKL